MKTITQATVETAISSIFTKEDVLKLLAEQAQELEANKPAPTAKLSKEVIGDIVSAITDLYERAVEDGIGETDFDSLGEDADVELSGREILVTIDSTSVVYDLTRNIERCYPSHDDLMVEIEDILERASGSEE